MDHQDWKTIVIQKNEKKNIKKIKYIQSKESEFEKNIEDGKLSHKKININYGKDIQKIRLKKNLTQKDLANKLNIPVKKIIEIESGKAKHDGIMMNKINIFFNNMK